MGADRLGLRRSRRPSGSGVSGRSVVWLLLVAVGLVYAVASGYWMSVIYLLLRLA